VIIKRMWTESSSNYATAPTWIREGWYLFGFIPLYVRDVTARPL
jgi:hypothetical protein